MLEGQRDKVVIGADQPREADNRADIAASGGERSDFGAGIEELGLDADGDHPPVTGGKMAISRARATDASTPTKSSSMAMRMASRSASAAA